MPYSRGSIPHDNTVSKRNSINNSQKKVSKRVSKTNISQRSSDQKNKSNKNFLGIVTGKPCITTSKKPPSRYNVMVQAQFTEETLNPEEELDRDRSFYLSKAVTAINSVQEQIADQ